MHCLTSVIRQLPGNLPSDPRAAATSLKLLTASPLGGPSPPFAGRSSLGVACVLCSSVEASGKGKGAMSTDTTEASPLRKKVQDIKLASGQHALKRGAGSHGMSSSSGGRRLQARLGA